MKTIFTILTAVIFSLNVNAQAPCPTGNITLTTQAEIDAFANVYAHCNIITGNLTISGPDITSTLLLANITTVLGDITIHDNPSLVMGGWHHLQVVTGNITVENNPNLLQLGFPMLSNVPQSIIIDGNDALQAIGMPNLQTVTWELTIGFEDGNASLTNLNGLGSLNSLGDLYIVRNTSLTDISALSNITSVGALDITHNPELTNLDGLNNLETVWNYLLIDNNTSLADISALSNLTGSVYDLSISGNPALTTLEGLNNITTIDYIYIHSNAVLSDITAIENADLSFLDQLYINYNPMLSYCHLSNICDYLEDASNHRSIYNNSGACEDETAVVNACNGLSVSELEAFAFNYYPNPVKDILTIETQKPVEKIEVFDLSGKKVLNVSGQKQLDMSSLAPGTYMVRIILKRVIETVKIIKK